MEGDVLLATFAVGPQPYYPPGTSRGEATFSLTGVGLHTLTLIYDQAPGEVAEFAESTQDFEYTVAPAETMLVLVPPAPGPQVFPGEELTLTVEVRTSTPPKYGIPTGLVYLKEGTTILETFDLVTDPVLYPGVARGTVTFSLGSEGTHLLELVYDPGAGADFARSNTQLLELEVIPVPPIIDPSPEPSPEPTEQPSPYPPPPPAPRPEAVVPYWERMPA
jgi:hypothetical protein